MDWTSFGAVGPIAGLLTPLVMFLWKKYFPAVAAPEFAGVPTEVLRRRNDWIDHIANSLMILGASSAVIPWALGVPVTDLLAPALGFGLMLWLPALFILSVTLPHGSLRLREYLRWYELKWGIGLKSISYVYMPFYAAALLALCYALGRLVA
jgi:hypothetical protein